MDVTSRCLRRIDGAVRIGVTKNASRASPDYDIDALSGATLTSRGVDNMMKFWMGEDGFRSLPHANLRSGIGSHGQ